MWNYCQYLGPFISSDGKKFDLGIHIEKYNSGRVIVSAATVYGNSPGDYYSGELDRFGMGEIRDSSVEMYEETRRRAKMLGLYNGPMRDDL